MFHRISASTMELNTQGLVSLHGALKNPHWEHCQRGLVEEDNHVSAILMFHHKDVQLGTAGSHEL